MVDLDVSPTQNELILAIDMLARGKAPGNDDIPAEVLQADKPALMEPLHSLLSRCWEEGTVPQDIGDVNIVTLYKNKGDRSDCNSYRGFLLLSIVSKAFARIILKRLQILAGGSTPNVNVASGLDDFLTKTTAGKKSRTPSIHCLY
jgi:hypothetical protein